MNKIIIGLIVAILIISSIVVFNFTQDDGGYSVNTLSNEPQVFTFSCNPSDDVDLYSDGGCCRCTDITNQMYYWICDIYHKPVTVYEVTITSLSVYPVASRGNMEISFQKNSWKQYASYEVDTSPYNPKPYTHTIVFDPPIEHVLGMKLNVENFYFDNLEFLQCYGSIKMCKYVEPQPEPEPEPPEVPAPPVEHGNLFVYVEQYPDGPPSVNKPVKVRRYDSAETYSAYTDFSGYAVFPSLEYDSYKVSIVGTDLEETINLNIPNYYVEFTLGDEPEPPTQYGRIFVNCFYSDDNEPIPGKSIQMQGLDVKYSDVITTDQWGTAVFSNCPYGTYIVSVDEKDKVAVLDSSTLDVYFSFEREEIPPPDMYGTLEVECIYEASELPIPDKFIQVQGVDVQFYGSEDTDESGLAVFSNLHYGTYIISVDGTDRFVSLNNPVVRVTFMYSSPDESPLPPAPPTEVVSSSIPWHLFFFAIGILMLIALLIAVIKDKDKK